MKRALLATLFLTACIPSDDSGTRTNSPEDGVSFAALDGWSVGRARATLVLTATDASVIAVRTVPRAGWSEPRDQRNVFSAVETVVRSLPRANVSGPAELEDAEYPGVAYDVEFTPAGRKHVRYHRRYATLIGDTRIIHVILTTAGPLDKHRREFDRIVRTIQEES